VLGRDAAATAGGREGRGGLGQELITPLQVDASIGFDQVRCAVGLNSWQDCMQRQSVEQYDTASQSCRLESSCVTAEQAPWRLSITEHRRDKNKC
jgi:hypothetical protein